MSPAGMPAQGKLYSSGPSIWKIASQKLVLRLEWRSEVYTVYIKTTQRKQPGDKGVRVLRVYNIFVPWTQNILEPYTINYVRYRILKGTGL